MVEDRLTDGTRIARLLSSEVHGRASGPLARLTVTDADTAVEPTEDGAFAFGIDLEGERLADVNIHPDRIHLAVEHGVDVAAEAGEAEGLRTRPKAVRPPQTLVFVESGAAVKRAVDVLAAVVESVEGPLDGDTET
jgi:hypothetical protein